MKILPNTYHLQAKESILLNVPAENKLQHSVRLITIFKKFNLKNHVPYIAIEFCSTGAKIGIKPLNDGKESQGCHLNGFEIYRNFPVSLE